MLVDKGSLSFISDGSFCHHDDCFWHSQTKAIVNYVFSFMGKASL
jgi:hypothetical protein